MLRPSSTLVVGASLAVDAGVLAIPVDIDKRAGMTETAAARRACRELLGDRVVHDGSPDLEAQVVAARVTVAAGGLRLVPGQRSDLLRAAVWALQLGVDEPAVVPAVHWASMAMRRWHARPRFVGLEEIVTAAEDRRSPTRPGGRIRSTRSVGPVPRSPGRGSQLERGHVSACGSGGAPARYGNRVASVGRARGTVTRPGYRRGR